MNRDEAKKFTDEIFRLIKKAKTIIDLEAIPDKLKIERKNKMDIKSYPEIKFSISEKEIQSLIQDKILDENLNFSENLSEKITNPLTKLLYATAWKNGDLKKIKHIIKGVKEAKNESYDQDDALVFFQFGKHLTKIEGQPIIDQHVIRAFGIYKCTENASIENLRKLSTLNKRHKTQINNYIKWLRSDELTEEIKLQKNYSYHIDKLLFATGKTIKSGKIPLSKITESSSRSNGGDFEVE
jgi:polyhydroxyalkanoate synthesis regulator phasin